MDFNFSDEQQLLRDQLANFIKRDYSFEFRKSILASEAGWSRDVWNKLAEMGLMALPLREAHGGLGGDGVDIYVTMEAIGRGLMVEPYFSTVVLGAGLIADVGSETQAATLLPQVAEGGLLLAAGLYEHGGRHDPYYVATRAAREAEGWRLDGAKTVVIHGAQADKLIVSARTGGDIGSAQGLSLFLFDADAPGVTRRDYPSHDGARAADIALSGVQLPASALLGSEGGAGAAIARIEQRACAALCAEAVGVMDMLNQATLEYLKTRRQFGVPIGKFQVLQHRAVDMLIATEEARSLALLASAQVDGGDDAAAQRSVTAAKNMIGRSGRTVGQGAVQLHGGIGVTDELRVAHWFKRLTMINQLFGDADYHLARFSDRLIAA